MTNLQDYRDLNRAKIRCWGIWVSHFVLAPVASAVYSAKANYWSAFWAATGVAAVSLPVAFVDFGLTLSVAPPLTSVLMLQGKVTESRRRKGFFGPEQAEAAMWGQSISTTV